MLASASNSEEERGVSFLSWAWCLPSAKAADSFVCSRSSFAARSCSSSSAHFARLSSASFDMLARRSSTVSASARAFSAVCDDSASLPRASSRASCSAAALSAASLSRVLAASSSSASNEYRDSCSSSPFCAARRASSVSCRSRPTVSLLSAKAWESCETSWRRTAFSWCRSVSLRSEAVATWKATSMSPSLRRAVLLACSMWLTASLSSSERDWFTRCNRSICCRSDSSVSRDAARACVDALRSSMAWATFFFSSSKRCFSVATTTSFAAMVSAFSSLSSRSFFLSSLSCASEVSAVEARPSAASTEAMRRVMVLAYSCASRSAAAAAPRNSRTSLRRASQSSCSESARARSDSTAAVRRETSCSAVSAWSCAVLSTCRSPSTSSWCALRRTSIARFAAAAASSADLVPSLTPSSLARAASSRSVSTSPRSRSSSSMACPSCWRYERHSWRCRCEACCISLCFATSSSLEASALLRQSRTSSKRCFISSNASSLCSCRAFTPSASSSSSSIRFLYLAAS
eukprot:Sspe_Gene.94533::Locus_66908_Transcript_1_1_Confidence_1.000_Length_1803::g.94533::m.94533